jgi:mono/diheme cytochrome c family protein
MIMKNTHTQKYTLTSLVILFLFTGFMAMAQDFPAWPVPDDEAARENPIAADKQSLEAGKVLYDMQCKACHGETGKGDGLIKAASLVSLEFQAQSDGAIFYKLHQGRGQMPSFKALPDDQLWNVINYVHSLSAEREDIVKKDATISLSFNEVGDKKELTAKIEAQDEEGKMQPVSGIRVNIGVDRYFGTLSIGGSPFTTNEKGIVSLTFPNHLIGDESGELNIVASIDDMEYNPVQSNETITWGIANPNDYWSERRALWKNNDYIPLWLLSSFVIAALAIWGTIMYVALLVRKIKIEGDKAG